MIFYEMFFSQWIDGKGRVAKNIFVYVVARNHTTFREATREGLWLQRNQALWSRVWLREEIEKINLPLFSSAITAIKEGDDFFILWDKNAETFPGLPQGKPFLLFH
jgi:hypothetical protein